ncbi:MAG: glycosyltransferase family 9 protein [Proteobacteria bacterium]|nr:MAG: glycosyltransferase family 9 protein [Pseudomonadota bacterium]
MALTTKNVSRFLVVRTDKIGDVTLTTPAIAALRKHFPEAKIVGLTSPVAAEIYRLNPHLNSHFVLDPAQYSGFLGFWRLVRRLRQEKFQAAVVMQTRMFVAMALLFSGIRFRIGPYSKWWSWFTYNLGRRQNRSAVEMHEADYNIQLLRAFGITVADTFEKTYLQVDEESRREAEKFFAEKGLPKKFKTVAIHPGMAGSALNWPEAHYTALARRLVQRYNVLITGGPGEGALVDRVYQGMARAQNFVPDQPVFTKYVGEKGLAVTIAIFDQCDAVVAPSTGPMHISVALGKKVVTIFPPIKVQSAVRWGPYGIPHGSNLGISPEDRSSVLVPDVNCAEDFRCALSACIYYPCMPRISIDDVETQVLALMEGGSLSMFKSSAMSSYEWDEALTETEEHEE